MSDDKQLNWLEDLQDRRFFRFVISYLIGSWGLIQFMDWLVKRYALSSSLVDLLIVLLLSLLPSVILFTYYHGRPGKDKWSKVERIFIPTNIVFAGALLFFLFSGNKLQATSEKVILQDERGETIERFVPKSEFMSRISIFPIELDASLGDENWLRHGVTQLLNYDLQQDNYIYAPTPSYLKTLYEIRNVDFEEDIPFSLKRKIAEDSFSDQFTTGTLRKEGNEYVLDISLYTCKDGKLVTSSSQRSNDLMTLVDKTTSALLEHLSLTETNGQTGLEIDLPVASIFSANYEALEAFSIGYEQVFLGNQLEEGLKSLKKAVKLDPDFTLVYLYLSQAYLRNNLEADAKTAINKGMDGIESLPERVQFEIRYRYYRINKQNDKALALLEMWIQLYPSNYFPYSAAMNTYVEQSKFEEAKKIGLIALEKGHGAEILVSLASISSLQGNLEEAISYYETFASRYPERASETSYLGTIYLRKGEVEKAEAHFQKLALLKPNDYQIIGRLAELEAFRANYEKVEQYYSEAFQKATSASDSAEIYLWQYTFYASTGECTKAIDAIEERWKILAPIKSPVELGTEKLSFNFIMTYLDGGFKDRYLAIQEKFFNTVPDQGGTFKCMSDLNFSIATRDSAAVNAAMRSCEAHYLPIIGQNGISMLRGYQEDINGNYEKSLEFFESYLEGLNLEDEWIRVSIVGEIYLRAGRFQEAIDMYSKALLTKPQNPIFHLSLAKAYYAENEIDKAKESLEKTLDLWRNADPQYVYYQEAKALEAEWGSR
ncbi:MAG: tetratricopeptide repeat protein [Saprospiraceae bacterium]|nr:tetratricopeptide repeat protein [Saprospiraceae bacterium]